MNAEKTGSLIRSLRIKKGLTLGQTHFKDF